MIHNIFQAWIVIWKAILNITAYNVPFASLIIYLPWKSHLLLFWCSQDVPLTFCQSFTPLELQKPGYIHYLTKCLKIQDNIQLKNLKLTRFWRSIFSKHTLCSINCSPPLHTHSQLKEDWCHWEAWLPFWALWHNEILGLEASCSWHLISNEHTYLNLSILYYLNIEQRDELQKTPSLLSTNITSHHTGLMLGVKSFCFTAGSRKCKPLKAEECILTNRDVKSSHTPAEVQHRVCWLISFLCILRRKFTFG